MTDSEYPDGDRWGRARALLEACLELAPAARALFLDQECADDVELRREIEHYLAADERPDGALDRSPEALLNALWESVEGGAPVGPRHRGSVGAEESAGAREIGPYRLHEVLGEGGMGTVYRAMQTEPVQREVALKVIKLGMDTKEVVARFESERQALAVMDHPSIAKVLDAGATGEGRPYFVMELVRGVPIDEYCDTHKLGTSDRIGLFVQLCDAIQHAHQKGVIHRDLKPSNVLVRFQDEGPVPKVIDFGVAKAVGSSLTDKTLLTSVGQVLGTPAYMSPEQAERTALDVDTRADVYSLGVMLYEVLSGTLPYDREMFRQPDFLVRHFLREKDVPTPSARLDSLAHTQETAARNRQTDVRTLRRELSGDLDWVVMKAMEKDRTRRYASAGELAGDLRRYRTSEPVSARPPSASYRFGKFARRHRGPLAAGIALTLSLVGGATVSTMGFVRADQNAALARAAAGRAQAVTSFLDQMLRTADPVRGGNISTTVEDVLDAASDSLAAGVLSDDPLVEIAVRRSIGATYMNLGFLDRAGEHLEAASSIQDATPAATDLERVALLNELGMLRRRRGESAEAEGIYRRALALSDSAGLSTDGGDGETLAVDTRNNLGLALRAMDRIDEAAVLLEGVAEAARGQNDAGEATALNNLALIRRAQGDFEGARGLFEEALDLLTHEYGDSHLYVAVLLESMGSLEQYAGRYQEAASLMNRSLAMKREILPAGPDVVNALNGLGLVLVQMGELDAAEQHLNEALEMSIEVSGETHTRTGSVLNSIGLLHLGREDAQRSEEAFRRSVAIREETLGPRHRTLLNTKANLAAALLLGGRAEDSEPLARDVVQAEREIGLTDAVMVGSAQRTWGQALAALERFEEAESELVGAHDLQLGGLGREHAQTQRSVEALIGLYEAWGRVDAADEWRGR